MSGLGYIAAVQPGDMARPVTEAEFDSITQQQFPKRHPGTQKTANNSTQQQTPVKLEASELPPDTIRIGIINFADKSSTIRKEASTAAHLTANFLAASKKFAVIEPDTLEAAALANRVDISGVIEPLTAAEIGRLTGCQYVVTGQLATLTEREIRTGDFISQDSGMLSDATLNTKVNNKSEARELLWTMAIELFGRMERFSKLPNNVVARTSEASIEVNASIIDAKTGKIVALLPAHGNAFKTIKIVQKNNGRTKSAETVDTESIKSSALASLAADLSDRIRTSISGEDMHVVLSSKNGIVINRGLYDGIEPGSMYVMYPKNKTPENAQAVIIINEVQDLYSVAELSRSMSEKYKPAPGTRLETVSFYELMQSQMKTVTTGRGKK